MRADVAGSWRRTWALLNQPSDLHKVRVVEQREQRRACRERRWRFYVALGRSIHHVHWCRRLLGLASCRRCRRHRPRVEQVLGGPIGVAERCSQCRDDIISGEAHAHQLHDLIFVPNRGSCAPVWEAVRESRRATCRGTPSKSTRRRVERAETWEEQEGEADHRRRAGQPRAPRLPLLRAVLQVPRRQALEPPQPLPAMLLPLPTMQGSGGGVSTLSRTPHTQHPYTPCRIERPHLCHHHDKVSGVWLDRVANRGIVRQDLACTPRAHRTACDAKAEGVYVTFECECECAI